MPPTLQATEEDGLLDAGTKSAGPSKTVFTGYVFTINFMMGAGVLAVPHAVVAGGWGIASIFAIVINLFALMTFFWLAEVQARAAILRNALKLDFVSSADYKNSSDINDEHAELAPTKYGPMNTPYPTDLVPGPRAIQGSDDPSIPDDWSEIRSDNLMEVGEMSEIWAGRAGKTAWSVIVLLFQGAVMWVYAVVWSESVLLIVPVPGITKRLECNANTPTLSTHCVHGIYVIFGVLVVLMVPFVSRNWSFMHIVQKFLIVMCYVSTIAMIVTSIIGMATAPYSKENAVGYMPPTAAPNMTLVPPTMAPANATGPYIHKLPFAKFSGFAEVFGNLVLVCIGQQGAALLMREMPLDKVRKTYSLAFGTITIWLMLLGIVVALYMGDATNPLVTLNFADYDQWGWKNAGGTIVGTIIALYPVCSTSAAYMLNIKNMAEAIERMFPMSWKERMSQKWCHREYRDGLMFPFQVPLRYGLILFSVGLSFATYQFEKALSVAGLFGFFIFFFAPVGLQIMSQRRLHQLGLPSKTRYDTPIISHPASAIFIAVVGLAGLVYYIVKRLVPQFTA